ncbi:hypothetical protein [Pararhizobium arenae]|uniref:hypothetical protein n=1 Tax=Pararhizobium arenae TaxID=1856850 RepID=UPI00094B192C|nr:hypothetical protein [Pararhizobium arenae]
MTLKDLESACTDFEDEHGIDAFLAAMAEIMERRMSRHGINLSFDHETEELFRDQTAGNMSMSTAVSRSQL